MTPVTLVIESVAKLYGRTAEEIIGDARWARLVDARHLAMVLVRHRFGWSYARIAEAFGNRDHTTVLHAIRSFPQRMKNDDQLRAIVEEFFPDAVPATAFTHRQTLALKRMIRKELKRSFVAA